MLFDKACVPMKTSMQALASDDDQVFHQSALHALRQIVLSLRFVLIQTAALNCPRAFFATYTSIAASLKKRETKKIFKP